MSPLNPPARSHPIPTCLHKETMVWVPEWTSYRMRANMHTLARQTPRLTHAVELQTELGYQVQIPFCDWTCEPGKSGESIRKVDDDTTVVVAYCCWDWADTSPRIGAGGGLEMLLLSSSCRYAS